jgi:hypothetical protein
VAFLGVVSSVSTTTASTTSSLIVRAAPGLGASTSPSSRSAANRWRHLPTVTLSQPSSSAILVFGLPSAQASAIRDRNANACDDECRGDQRTSVSLFIGQLDRDRRSTRTSHHRLLLSRLLPLRNQLQTTKSRFQEIRRRSNLTGHYRVLGVALT